MDHAPETDTTPDARAVQRAVLRRQTGAQRVAIAVELSQLVRELMLAGLRSRHAGWSERDLARELLRQACHPTELPPDLP